MAQRILGLDLGATSVKGVLLDSTFRGFSLVDAGSIPLGAADGGASTVDRQAAAARELLAARGWRFDTAVVAFPGVGAASHVVSLPFSDMKRIEQTVRFEVEGQIPFDLAEVAWDWQPLESRAERTDLYVGVVRKEDLAGLLSALAGAGIDPQVVVPAAPAYASLLVPGAVAPLEDGTPEVIVDVGQDRTSVCVTAAGRCLAARTLAVGTAALQAGLAPLARELRTTIRAFEARSPGHRLGRAWLCGGGAHLPGLAEMVAAETGAAAQPLELSPPSTGAVPPEEVPGLALALALALRGHLGGRSGRLNLRRGDLASTRDFEHVRGQLTRLGLYAALVLLLAVVGASVKVLTLARHEALLDRSLCDVTQKVVGKCFDDFAVAEAVLKGRGNPISAIPRVSAVNVLGELAARAPDVPLRFDRIEITRDKLHLQGTTDAAENVDRIVGALKASRCFGEARSGGARKRGNDGKFEFTIDSDLTCEGAAGGKG
jgi:general secretion pathway protein L